MGLERFIPDTETVAKTNKTAKRRAKRNNDRANGRLGIRRKSSKKKNK